MHRARGGRGPLAGSRPEGPAAGEARRAPWSWPLLVAGVLILANLPALLGWVATDPRQLVSGLGQATRGPLLTGLSSIDPNNGFTLQALGIRAAEDWLHGHVPWWNPFEGLGAPLAAEMQAGAFFPPTLLLLLPRGVLLDHLFLELVGALATYALGRQFGLRAGWAAAMGVAFGLNGTFAWLGNAAASPVAFLPVTLLGVERCLAGRRAGWGLAAAGVALGWYAGFPETAALDGLLTAVWALARLAEIRPRRQAALSGAKLAGAGVTGCLLAAPLLAPFAAYLGISDTLDHQQGFNHVHLASAGAATTGFPYLFGPIFGWLGQDPPHRLLLFWSSVGGYVTFTVLLLACVGLLAAREHRVLRSALAGWAAVFLARSYGFPPAMALLARIPGFSAIAVQRYCPPSCELALTVLAGFGLQAFARASRPRLLGGLLLAPAIAALLWLNAAGLRTRLAGYAGYATFATVSAAAVAGIALAAAAALWLPPRARSALLGVMMAAEAAAAFAVPQFSAPRAVRLDLAPVRFLRAHLGQERFFTVGDPGEPLSPNYGSAYGLGELDVNDLPVPRLFGDVVRADLAPSAVPNLFIGVPLRPGAPSPVGELVAHEAAYADAGVAYLLAPAAMPIVGFGRPVSVSPTAAIYAVPGSRPLFSVLAGGPCRLTVTGPTTARGMCAAPARIRWAELRLPGWQAEVNGRPADLTPSGTAFQQLAVPPGAVSLALTYLPPGAPSGLALGALGLAISAAVTVRAGSARRPRPHLEG